MTKKKKPVRQTKAEAREERIAAERTTILLSEGVQLAHIPALLKRHGLDKGRLGTLGEDAWLVRLADILRNREFPWWNH